MPVVRVDCFLGNGMAVLTVTSPVGVGYEYSLDGAAYSGTRTFMGVDNGNHTVSVRSAGGCITNGDPFAVSCGCVNRPTLNLSSRSGSACGTTPVTVTGNTFGGSATSVTITEDGGGSVSQEVINASPFTITYTPVAGDVGHIVTITITTNNPLGSPCEAAIATYSLTVNPVPSAPVPGLITHPTCTSTTGSVVISGLPASGSWALTRTPGNVTTQGSGTTTTITGIASGTYTFVVTNNGCPSPASAAVVINPQPAIPSAPVAGTLVQPTCILSTGTINLNGLPATGNWTLTRYPGIITTTGTGVSTSIPGLSAGTYNFTITSSSGCTSPSSANIVINPQPSTPAAPVPGAITAPTCAQPEGTVVLSGLPSAGRWTINSIPAGVTQSGNAGSTTVRGLVPGAYTFTVTSSAGCVSAPTTIVLIPAIPDAPVLTITDPSPVCSPATVDITAPAITAGSTAGVTYTYWTNQIATNQYATPKAATAGTYYIKATNPSQCIVIKPVHVTVLNPPTANAGQDQELNYVFTANVSAVSPGTGETGSWSVFEGTGSFADPSSAVTIVNDLSEGENIFLWKVTNGACPDAVDTLKIKVKDLTIPTLITPNEDGINDYFVLNGIEAQPGNQLLIFDRRGVMVFKDTDYKNDWNGTDYKGHHLADDTYFFVLKTGNGKQRSGFIVIRR
jgi:gliding motility-associated-like protein